MGSGQRPSAVNGLKSWYSHTERDFFSQVLPFYTHSICFLILFPYFQLGFLHHLSLSKLIDYDTPIQWNIFLLCPFTRTPPDLFSQLYLLVNYDRTLGIWLRSLPNVDIIRRAKAQEQTVKMYKKGKEKQGSVKSMAPWSSHCSENLAYRIKWCCCAKRNRCV